MLDLLWSTGELRSVALLALRLQALGVLATGVNVHQTGLLEPEPPARPDGPSAVRRVCSSCSPRTTSWSRQDFWRAGTAIRSSRSAAAAPT